MGVVVGAGFDVAVGVAVGLWVGVGVSVGVGDGVSELTRLESDDRDRAAVSD